MVFRTKLAHAMISSLKRNEPLKRVIPMRMLCARISPLTKMVCAKI